MTAAVVLAGDRASIKELTISANPHYTRDHIEGTPGFGGSAPEGLVYFPEVLAFYLNHRSVSRLLDPPDENEPLGKILLRITEKSNWEGDK